MKVIYPISVDDGLMQALYAVSKEHVFCESRNGGVWKVSTPVTTVWRPAASYVSTLPQRNANPFFHLMEALWMLAGRNDLAFVSRYASNMAQYSDDGGVTQPGAYGHRWRNHFDADQLAWARKELRDDPSTRRVVLSMWDGYNDPTAASVGSKDVPCNTHAYFDLSSGVLDMTVCCRSNDIVWGCYGSNVVHFSILLEYMAAALGVPRGTYYQVSNNLHLYTERPDAAALYQYALNAQFRLPYDRNAVKLHHELIMPSPKYLEAFNGALKHIDALRHPYGVPFLDYVAAPMQEAWAMHKAGNTQAAIDMLGTAPIDWLVAGRAWLQRALDRKNAKVVDGEEK